MKKNKPAADKWKVLTKSDLGGFDAVATDVVLTAMELGADGRVSTGGRALIRNPENGEIMTVARTVAMQNRGAQNTRAQFKRIWGMTLDEAKAKVKQVAKEQRKTAVGAALEKAQEALKEAEQQTEAPPERKVKRFVCTRKNCGAAFFEEKELRQHVIGSGDHYPCPEWAKDACEYVAATPQGAASHNRLAHLGEKPRKGTGKKVMVPAKTVKIPPTQEEIDEYLYPSSEDEPPTEFETTIINKMAEDSEQFFINDQFITIQLTADPAQKLEAIAKLLGGSPADAQRIEELEKRVGELEDQLDDAEIIQTRLTSERDEAKARADLVEEELNNLVKSLQNLRAL